MRSQINNKKEWKYHFIELLTATLNAINSYLFYWKRQIMNKHHKIISLNSVYPHQKV